MTAIVSILMLLLGYYGDPSEGGEVVAKMQSSSVVWRNVTSGVQEEEKIISDYIFVNRDGYGGEFVKKQQIFQKSKKVQTTTYKGYWQRSKDGITFYFIHKNIKTTGIFQGFDEKIKIEFKVYEKDKQVLLKNYSTEFFRIENKNTL